jgi:predicted homoserine dehydrogenase-like protein
MMNAEADLIFGPYLLAHARRHGVVYTSADGDQPGVIRRLIADEIESWGFELVMAGNMKGFLDRRSNPTTIIPEARKRDFDPRMTAGFTDGSKLAVEMALVANAFGLRTAVPGMGGPRVAHVRDVLEQFDFDALRRDGPVVDYVLGAQPDGGVFAVGYCSHAYQRSMLATFKMGPGPYYVFYRPYHLCHVQAMPAVLAAARGGALLQPWHGFRTNVIAYAKERLARGTALDGFGGYTCYGLIENVDPAHATDGLPLCLADGITLTRDVAQDERLTLHDVRYDPASPGFAMFAKALDASAVLA